MYNAELKGVNPKKSFLVQLRRVAADGKYVTKKGSRYRLSTEFRDEILKYMNTIHPKTKRADMPPIRLDHAMTKKVVNRRKIAAKMKMIQMKKNQLEKKRLAKSKKSKARKTKAKAAKSKANAAKSAKPKSKSTKAAKAAKAKAKTKGSKATKAKVSKKGAKSKAKVSANKKTNQRKP